MPMGPAAITKAQFQANIQQSALSPYIDSSFMQIPINFSGVQNLQRLWGTYTPNNDYLYLLQGATLQNAPNFAIIHCDSQLNLSFVSSHFGNQTIASLPFQKFGFLSWVPGDTYFTQGIFVEGRTAVDKPMPQGVPVNYTVILGQATIN